METAVDRRVCASCGNPCLPDGRFCLFCGDVLPEFGVEFPVLTETPDSPIRSPKTIEAEYAGFWLRVWAGLIDATLECAGALVLTVGLDFGLRWLGPRVGMTAATSAFFAGMAFIVLLSVGAWLYSALMESSPWQATLGKRAVGLQVLTSTGQRLSFGQATVRHLMKFLSLFTAAVGFMMSGWTKRRQALHDLPVDAIVVRVPPPSISLFG